MLQRVLIISIMRAYHFLWGCTAREGFRGELVPHGGQVPVQQIQSSMHPGRIAVIPRLLCTTQPSHMRFWYHILLSYRGQIVAAQRAKPGPDGLCSAVVGCVEEYEPGDNVLQAC